MAFKMTNDLKNCKLNPVLIRALEQKCFRISPVELAGNRSDRNEFLFKNYTK